MRRCLSVATEDPGTIMKAITLEKPGNFAVGNAPMPVAPGADEALIRIHRVGICGTDLHAFAGRQPFFSYPRRLGHELGVEVLEAGRNVRHIVAGDRCAVLPYVNCQQCSACLRGKTNCCQKLSVLGVHADGGMCEYLTVPARLLYPSSQLSFDQLALIEPLAIGAHAVRRADIQSGEWALVVGAGPIGLATAQFAELAGAQVMVLDVNTRRLDFCREQLGVRHCLSASQPPLAGLLERTGEELSTAVFDCTGNKGSMEQSFHYVAHGGRLTFVGLVQDEIRFHDPEFHRRELTLLATRNATSDDFQLVMQAIESGRVNVTPWITHRCAFDDFLETFPIWNQPGTGVVKGVVEF